MAPVPLPSAPHTAGRAAAAGSRQMGAVPPPHLGRVVPPHLPGADGLPSPQPSSGRHPHGGAPQAVGGPPPQFFVDHKRGEVNELRQLLRSVQTERDITKKRDAIKRVIAYMTLGIDVSRLFFEMVMASSTNDLVQKKMIYLYLTNYAESNRELTILAINTFLKDCGDEDPTIRGLAIRSLCSLKLSNIAEYVEPAIRKGLRDPNTYVRKTSVIGTLKLHAIHPVAVKQTDFVDILYTLLYDNEPLVVTNAIYALNEILAEEGGLEITRELIGHLVNRIKNFNEWGQCAILTLLTNYILSCRNDEEIYDVMNIIEDRLKQASASVVLSCAKCFIEITRYRPALARQVLFRLKNPLLTLMATSPPELSYTVLVHIRLLASTSRDAAETLEADFKIFFCRYNDPSYTKACKLDILTYLASESNVVVIQSELADCVSDVDVEIAKQSIIALGRIAYRVPVAAESVLSQLLSFLSFGVGYVTTATLIVLKDLLRKYPQHFKTVMAVVSDCFKMAASTEDPDGLAALLWLIGESGDDAVEAPYMLESLVYLFDSSEAAASTSLKLHLLTSSMRLFLKRPAEVQHTLGQVLKKAVQEGQTPEVRDRALLYYRLLLESSRTPSKAQTLEEANRVILAPKSPIIEFRDSSEVETSNRLLLEFDSLSVMYGQPASKFIVSKPIPFGGRVSTRLEETDGDSPEGRRTQQTATGDELRLTTASNGADVSDDGGPPEDFSTAEQHSRVGGARRLTLLSDDSAAALDPRSSSGPEEDDMLGLSTSPRSASAGNRRLSAADKLGGFLGDDSRPPSGSLLSVGGNTARTEICVEDLDAQVVVSPADFASLWTKLPVAVANSGALPISALRRKLGSSALACDEIEKLLSANKIRCMASGQSGSSGLKLFFFAKDRISGLRFFVEVQVDTESGGSVKVTVKTDRDDKEEEAREDEPQWAELFLLFVCKSLGDGG